MKVHGADKAIFNINDFAKTAPEFGFSRTLNKIIFKNREAFYLCVIATENPTVLDGVPINCDDEFKSHLCKELKIEPADLKYNDIKLYIQKNIVEAMQVLDQIEKHESYKMFIVNPNDPNNVNDMYHIKSKANSKKHVKIQNDLQ